MNIFFFIAANFVDADNLMCGTIYTGVSYSITQFVIVPMCHLQMHTVNAALSKKSLFKAQTELLYLNKVDVLSYSKSHNNIACIINDKFLFEYRNKKNLVRLNRQSEIQRNCAYGFVTQICT